MMGIVPRTNNQYFLLFALLIITSCVFLFVANVKYQRDYLQMSATRGRGMRLFCLILTTEDSLETKAKIVAQTWARKCDMYKLVSVIPKDLLKQIGANSNSDIHELADILQPHGFNVDKYDKLTDKVYLSLKYVFNKYNDFDWYLKADDDTFIFVDNLRTFLADKNASQPVTYGYDFKVIVERGYHSGGGGYVLSREALSRLGSALNENYKFCPNQGVEDVDVARCLRKVAKCLFF
jgi:glycoprotein-N-acetylgalactosamine 3-beta-galactosyltransferase